MTNADDTYPERKENYHAALENIERFCLSVPNTPMLAQAKVMAMITLNMEFEERYLNHRFHTCPYPILTQMITETSATLQTWRNLDYLQSPGASLEDDQSELEDRHQELFQGLWDKFSPESYSRRIERYDHRLHINSLGPFVKDKKCIDFGCGHGNFAHSMINMGAKSVYALDFGESNIRFATKARDRIGLTKEQIDFQLHSVYETPCKSNHFEFATQHGVFHHLENPENAYREVHRVLKPKGWFWVFTEGSGGIYHHLWELSVKVLKPIPCSFVLNILDRLCLTEEKRYYLGDRLMAEYKFSTWEGIISMLNSIGFDNARRLKGGYETDFDADRLQKELYSKELFGEGDLRLLIQKI